MPANVVGEKAWVGVKKMRSQRHYQGMTYELTQLSVRNDVWWSIALEMAIPEANRSDSRKAAQVVDRFEAIVNQVSQTYRGPKLECDRSFAYPTWLAPLTR